MFKKLIILIVLFYESIPVFAQYADIAWIRRYNGPGNGDDYAHAVALDNSGNVYVTGESYGSGTNSDYATIKYDSAGNQLWVARYNGPGDSYDISNAMALDKSGNIYVTGYSSGNGTQDDYATVKYDSQGNQLWVARYNGPANADDIATAITLDNAGNAYVTGYSYGSGTWWDYATIKYDSLGNQLWVQRYNGPANSIDDACAIALDISGNVYVTGWSIGIGTGYDYATIKYDSLGNQLWVERYNGPGSYDDQAYAIALDSSGCVYVTGYSYGNGPSQDYAPQDYATIKYDSQGNQLWVERYHGYTYGDNVAHAVTADKSGYVYVTGYSGGLGTSHDYVTIKYDSVGNQLWVETYNGPANGGDAALAIALDNSGNVYVTGTSYGGEPYHDYGYATVKYDSLGNQLWAKRYDPAANGSAVAWSIATDDLGNVFVTGWSPVGATSYDYVTIKYRNVPFMRGDADGDKKIMVSDVIYIINYLFRGGPSPMPQPIVADVDCDGQVTVGDVIYLINYLFKGGLPPNC